MRITKAYDEYVDSGLAWVGHYPKLWNLTKVKYEAYVKARVGWHGLKSDDFTEEGPYLVTGTDFKGDSINWNDCYHCNIERYEQDPYIQLRNGDLLITKDGTIGKVALVENLEKNDKATLNSGVFVVRPLSRNLATKFYFWLLQSKVFKDFVDFYKTGSTILHLYQDTFVNFIYATPSLTEQTRIATFLNYETARIDRLIVKQQQLIELLKEKRLAVISHAVTKGLNPYVPMKDSGVEWLGHVPEHWASIRVKQVSTFITSGPRGWSDFISENGEEVFLQSGDLNNELGLELDKAKRVTPPKNTEGVRTKLIDGDVVVCITGANTGRVAIVENLSRTTYINQHLSLIRPLTSKISSKYLGFSLASSGGRSFFDVVQYGLKEGLSLSNICEVPIALPPIDEQHQIAKHIESKNIYFDKLTSFAIHQVDLLRERRTALISAAVSGKIDLRGWTPRAEEGAA
ncbi:restriction endonuclease subunit S [Aeromonas rivipollensis]|uniref:restriction endonuclease subunit S n=1 Tax=Aeromonas rivipollensis TaxID=948519 RepID=UPI0029738B5D|nr:restriction endonuclease subunit S [Aeromonas rivipollensis]